MLGIDFRKNKNSRYDGEIYIAVNNENSDIVIGSWSGAVNAFPNSTIYEITDIIYDCVHNLSAIKLLEFISKAEEAQNE